MAAAEEPAIVRFQVLKELSDAASEVIIDYTPIGEAAPGEERRALVLTVRRELLAAYQRLCQAAGLKLLALTPRPFGTLACLRESVKKWEGTGAFAEVHKNGSPQAAVALLTAAENWSEFCLVRGDTLLLARSLPAGPTLPAEVRRNLAMYTAQSPRHVVSGLYLAGNGETAGGRSTGSSGSAACSGCSWSGEADRTELRKLEPVVRLAHAVPHAPVERQAMFA